MSTIVSQTTTRSSKSIWIIGLILIAGGALWYFGAADRLVSDDTVSEQQERTDIYHKSVAAVASQSATWPQTEAELLKQFWKAISAKNAKQATVYCPGSKESDFAAYMHMPTKDEIQVGQPVAHPTASGVKLWPLKVHFAGYGAKTIKLAVQKLPAGQLVIDGRNSIWW